MMQKTVQCVAVTAVSGKESWEVEVHGPGEEQPIPGLEIEFTTEGKNPGIYLRQGGSESYHRIEDLKSLKICLKDRTLAYTRSP